MDGREARRAARRCRHHRACGFFVGWHFLYEGLTKLTSPSWSAAGYMKQARGPFAELFRWVAASPNLLDNANLITMWGLTIVGVLLILGLFTRLASLGGIAFILLFYLSQPAVHRLLLLDSVRGQLPRSSTRTSSSSCALAVISSPAAAASPGSTVSCTCSLRSNAGWPWPEHDPRRRADLAAPASVRADLQDDDPDGHLSVANHPQASGCRPRQVDDGAPAVIPPVRPAIDDAHFHGAAVLEVGDPHLGSKRQSSVRSNQLPLIERLAARALVSVERPRQVRGGTQRAGRGHDDRRSS